MSRIRLLIAGILVFVMSGFVLAQDDMTPTLEDVTGTDEYHGQFVSLEGVVREFLGSRIFVLSEGVTLDDDAVLVINMGPELPLEVVNGARVTVSGTIEPSLDYIEQNGLTPPTFATTMDMDTTTDTDMAVTDADMTATADASMSDTDMVVTDADMTATAEVDMSETDMNETDMATDDMMMTYPDAVGFVYAGNLPDDFRVYTILVIQSDMDVTVLPDEE